MVDLDAPFKDLTIGFSWELVDGKWFTQLSGCPWCHQSLPQGWLHHMLQDRRGDTINSFIPGWEHVRFLPASQKFVSSPVEVVSTKKNQKGVMWYLVVIHLLGYPGILSFGQEGDSPVLPREVEGTNGEFLTISTSIRSRSISQPFTTEGLANPDHPRSIVQPKASLLDFFRQSYLEL